LIMLLGIAGVCFAPDLRRALPTLLWVAVATGLAALTIGHPRLRLPIVVAFVPFCAYALLRLWGAWRLRRGRRADGVGGPPLRRGWRMYAAAGGCALFILLIGSTRYVTWLAGERHALAARWAVAA